MPRVNRLARYLLRRTVSAPSGLVAVGVRVPFDLVVAMYAIVKTGGAYVPLDPDHPADRTGYMLDSARRRCVLTPSRDGPTCLVERRRRGRHVRPRDTATIRVRDRRADVGPLPATPRLRDLHLRVDRPPQGRRGRRTRAIVNQLAVDERTSTRSHADDVYLQKTATTFDVSVWEFFWPLRAGAPS